MYGGDAMRYSATDVFDLRLHSSEVCVSGVFLGGRGGGGEPRFLLFVLLTCSIISTVFLLLPLVLKYTALVDLTPSRGNLFFHAGRMASLSLSLLLLDQIVSGRQLPKPGGAEKGEIIDPYVNLSLLGVPRDCQKAKSTKVIQDNGFNPIWNETSTFEVFFFYHRAL